MKLFLNLTLIAALVAATGCADLRGARKRNILPSTSAANAENGEGESGGSGTTPTVPPTAVSPQWSFSGYRVLEQTLREELKITGSNRDANAENAILGQLAANAANFGLSNYAAGQAQNLAAEPAKFKFLTELTADACTIGLRDPLVLGRLFPNVRSVNDWTNAGAYDHIFRRLIGRRPSSGEVTILNRLVQDGAISRTNSPPYLNQAAAVCTVVLNSLEFNHAR